MAHGHGGEHSVPHFSNAPGSRPFFSDEEWRWFEKEDTWAAKMIVGLMSTIFSIGFLIYCTIAIVVKG